MEKIVAKKPTMTVGDRTYEVEQQRDGRIAFRSWPCDGGKYGNGKPEFHEFDEVPDIVKNLKPAKE